MQWEIGWRIFLFEKPFFAHPIDKREEEDRNQTKTERLFLRHRGWTDQPRRTQVLVWWRRSSTDLPSITQTWRLVIGKTITITIIQSKIKKDYALYVPTQHQAQVYLKGNIFVMVEKTMILTSSMGVELNIVAIFVIAVAVEHFCAHFVQLLHRNLPKHKTQWCIIALF